MAESIVPHPRRANDLPPVADIGDDGEFLLMRGHVDKRLAAAAIAVHLANLAGVDYATEILFDGRDDGLVAVAADVRHTYAVEWFEGDDHPLMPGNEVGPEGWVRFDVGPEVRGGFPVTVFNQEA